MISGPCARKALSFVSAGLVSASLICSALPVTAVADPQSDLDAARARLEEIGSQTDSIMGTLAELNDQLEQTDYQIAEKQTQLTDYQVQLSNYVSNEYKNGSNGLVRAIVGVDTLDDMVNQLFYFSKVADSQADAIENIKTIKSDLEEQRSQHEQAISDTQSQIDSLNAQQSAASALVDSLSAEVRAQLEREAEENAALQAAIEASQAEEAPQPTVDEPQVVEEDTTPAAPSRDEQEDSSDNASSSNDNSSQQEPSYSPSTGNAIVDRAYSCIGVPYVYGAVGPDAYDCSGLVSYCVTGRHTRAFTSSTLCGYPSVSNPQPGDICVRPGHVGVYIGNGQMIHAPSPGKSVCITSVQSGMWYVRV